MGAQDATSTVSDVRVTLEGSPGIPERYTLEARTEVSVPGACGRKALRGVVLQLLQADDDDEAMPDFHFAAIIQGKRHPLRTTLAKFAARHEVGDEALVLEYYIPVGKPKAQAATPPHEAWLHALDFAPGRGMLTGGGDGSVQLRSADGTPLGGGGSDCHAAPVKAVCWGAEGCLLTAGQDEAVRLWREDGECVAQLRAEEVDVSCSFESLAVIGENAAAGAFDGSVWLLPGAAALDGDAEQQGKKRARTDMRTLDATRLGDATGLCTSAVAFGGDGVLRSAGWDGTMRLWDSEALRCTATVPAGGRCVTGLCVGETHCVVSSIDGAVRLLDARGEKGVVDACRRKGAHTAIANDVAWVSRDLTAVSCGADGTLRVWDLRALELPLHVVRHGEENVNVLAVGCSEGVIASCGSDGRVATFEVK